MSQKRTKSKKNKRKNLLINILAGFLTQRFVISLWFGILTSIKLVKSQKRS